MSYRFIHYPKCTTCQKAKQYLENHNIAFEERHIVENPPTVQELRKWILQSGYPVKKFFNTSGLVYKSLNLKEKLEKMSETEQIELLASNGMLVKRPLIIGENLILVGFKEKEWNEKLLSI